ncbi:MAG TPA: hypothetical protein PL063_02380 [Candidatus Cloacimonadota bacterium]|nr:hypothetical protein [Candidatus Cloacimonadota bacterium]
MKINNALQNQKGSALIEVLAAMGILLFAIIGMMISISYANYKSTLNYHYRVALLKAEAELQVIKLQHSSYGTFGNLGTQDFTIRSHSNAKPINAKISFEVSTVNDPQTTLRTAYTSITARVRWLETLPMHTLYVSPNEYKEVVVREDYFYERPQ